MTHEFGVRVYYEDTDMAGIVYYANYLKFIERARTEFVSSLGVDQKRLRREKGLAFAVRRLEADFLKPAGFGDDLAVFTAVEEVSGARAVLSQDVLRGGERLFSAKVTIVCIAESGIPARLPAGFAAAIKRRMHGGSDRRDSNPAEIAL